MTVPAPPTGQGITASQLLARFVGRHHRRIDTMFEGTRAGDDPECLHKMRTSTRRLRAALRLCRGAIPKAENRALQAELAWLARALGEVRDLDVMILELPRLLAPTSGEPSPGQADLLAWLRPQRDAACEALRPVLDSARCDALIQRLAEHAQAHHPGRKAQRPAAVLLRPRLLGQLELLYTLAAEIDRDSPDEQLHRLRVFNKKLRYGCELAEPALPVAVFAPALRITHDLLGEHQDASVASEWVQRFASAHPGLPASRCASWEATLGAERQRLRAAFLDRLPDIISALGQPQAPAAGTLAELLVDKQT